ncbi:MAG: DUF262 domain-containing protein [Pseudonocardiaceae bacterium]
MALDSPLLSRFLKDVKAGQLQLPDFQREWKWDDDRIRSLLATLTLGYPMGVVMTLVQRRISSLGDHAALRSLAS